MVVSSIVKTSNDTKVSHEPAKRREPERAILESNRFQRAVAHPALAANKQHAGGTELTHYHRVVARP
jgi:hypothetical protein